MSKFIHIVILLLMGVAVAKGQSSYLMPYPGAIHTYSASVTDIGNINPVRWYVATDNLGTQKAEQGTDFTFISPGFDAEKNVLAGIARYVIQIQWGESLSKGKIYYLFIEVDDNITGCTNRMGMPITISGGFNALVSDVTGSANPATVDPKSTKEDIDEETCPGLVRNPIWNGNEHTDIGSSDLVFRVNRQFSNLAWQFEYLVSEKSGKPFTIESIRFVDEGGLPLYQGKANRGVVNASEDDNYVLVYLNVLNQQGVALDVDFELVTANNLTRDAANYFDGVATDNVADHTILAMPAITGFGGK
jgi:hypothetical protein